VGQLQRLLISVAAFFGTFPALKSAGVVEAEDDLVFVVVGTARAEDVGATN
jgi:hypothetical protein